MTVSPVSDVLDRVLAVLNVEPSGILSDFDGTLSQIAPLPDAAVLHPDIARILPDLSRQLPLLAVITGRSAADAAAKIGIPEMLYVGNHGLEWSENGSYRVHEAGRKAERAVADALADIDRDLRDRKVDLDGMLFENKRFSASIHFRMVVDPAAFEAVLTPIATQRAAEHGLRLTGGKMMVELRPTTSISKGSAVEEIVAERNLKSVIFLGDDVTDVDAFRAVKRLREDGTLEDGLVIGVLSADANVLVAEESDLLLGSVDEVAALFIALSERLAAVS